MFPYGSDVIAVSPFFSYKEHCQLRYFSQAMEVLTLLTVACLVKNVLHVKAIN